MPSQIKDSYSELQELAQYLRGSEKKNTIIFAHNGVGKTTLSMVFKNVGKDLNSGAHDTLYYNAYTEDLFYWDNDLANDEERVLMFRRESRFFAGLDASEMESRIRTILSRYSDFDFSIMLDVPRTDENGDNLFINYITFKRMKYDDESQTMDWRRNIKISRGEETIFKWCFFLAVAQMVYDGADEYKWVKYVYIDDPISSLDDDNAILVANHLASLIKSEKNSRHTIISTHHGLFYNVIYNELKKADKFYLYNEELPQNDVTQQSKFLWKLKNLSDTPFFHHISVIKELNKAVSEQGHLYTYHFNMLRSVLEKTAAFHGYKTFGECIKKFENDPDEILYSRMINIFSHGNYSVFEPIEMNEENKKYFREIYKTFKEQFRFNENL